MIVIHFWYVVSNVFVYLSGSNIIYILIPGCRAASIQTDDAYAYPEELTDVETFSPELTEPIPDSFFDEVTKGAEKIGAFEDISNGSDTETPTKSSNLYTKSVTEITTSLASLSNQTNSSSSAATKTRDLYTNATTTPTSSDASTYATKLITETIAPPISTTFCSETSTDLYNASTTEKTTPPSSSDASTNSSDLYTESVTEISTSLASLSNQTNNSSSAATKTSDLYTDATTTPTTPTSSDASTYATKLITETIAPPISTTFCSKTSTDLHNASTTEETTPPSGSDASTNTSDFYTDSITTGDLYTVESTTTPVMADLSNISESTTTQSLPTASDLEPIGNLTINPATNNVSDFNHSIVSSTTISADSQDISASTNLVEEYNKLVETSTQSLSFDLTDHSTPEVPTKDILGQSYDEEAAISTTFSPIYEEGYHDPKRAPTRYGQQEEYETTSSWKFASDYGIGMRDYNLILYAVNNTAVLEKGSLLNYVYYIFKEILHVNMTLCDIRYCRYLRSKTHDNTKKVPPVLVAFTKMEVKNEILHKRKLLKPTNIKVEHDMPKKILEEQNALLKPLMEKYRAMGQYVVVRSGKLLVEGKVLTQIYLPDKYTYDPLQTFVSYVSSTARPTTSPMAQLPREFADYGFGGDKKSGKKKKGGKAAAGGKKKRKPMIRIPLDDEIGRELSVEVLFTTRRFWL